MIRRINGAVLILIRSKDGPVLRVVHAETVAPDRFLGRREHFADRCGLLS